MDLSLEDIIKTKKLTGKKPQAAKAQQRQQQQQQQQRRPAGVAQGRVGDVREKINQRRNLQLRGQDARQRILEKKRQNITDARQLLKPKEKPVEFVLPQKVIKNNLYRAPPPPTVTLEYDQPPVRRQQRAAPENRIPVHVSSRSHQPPARQPPPPPRQQQQVQQQQQQQQLQQQRSAPSYRDRSRSPPRRGSAQQPAVVQGYKVSIANLHEGVTREDIYELFSSVGSVKKCVLLRPGDAEVVYLKREDAQAALRRYDRRELDGMPMKLRVSTVGLKVSGGAAPGVSEQAVRAALFRSDAAGRHQRPVNFQVSV